MKSLTLALMIGLLSTAAALAQPSLKGDITVNADLVTVGDMFDNPGELSETAIFRAPAPGTTGIVPIANVASAAKLVGITGFDNVGYTRIRVTRLTTVVDAPALSSLITAELDRRGLGLLAGGAQCLGGGIGSGNGHRQVFKNRVTVENPQGRRGLEVINDNCYPPYQSCAADFNRRR